MVLSSLESAIGAVETAKELDALTIIKIWYDRPEATEIVAKAYEIGLNECMGGVTSLSKAIHGEGSANRTQTRRILKDLGIKSKKSKGERKSLPEREAEILALYHHKKVHMKQRSERMKKC